MPRIARPRHESALVTSYLRQLRASTPPQKPEARVKDPAAPAGTATAVATSAITVNSPSRTSVAA